MGYSELLLRQRTSGAKAPFLSNYGGTAKSRALPESWLRVARLKACPDTERIRNRCYSEQAAGFCGEDVQGGFEASDGLFESGVTIEFGTKVLEQGVGFTNLLFGVACGLLGLAGRSFHGVLLC